MTRERRVVKRILGKNGVLTDKAGKSAKVRFSLTQCQDYLDGLPSIQSADGSIEFQNARESLGAIDGELRTLTGAGIETKVYIDSMGAPDPKGTFKVTGPVNDI